MSQPATRSHDSSYAAMGTVMVSDRVAEPFYRPEQTLLHGITFAGHPVSAAIALHNIEVFERDNVLAHVRELTPYLQERMRPLTSLPIVGDIRGDGFFYAVELVGTEDGARVDPEQRELLVRDYLPRRIREAGLIARADDRGEPVVQIAPPLVSTRAELDMIVESLHEVLTDAGAKIGLTGAR
jgi:adenosylmethionine-8-amino-7-oxononanoate aminotransferase